MEKEDQEEHNIVTMSDSANKTKVLCQSQREVDLMDATSNISTSSNGERCSLLHSSQNKVEGKLDNNNNNIQEMDLTLMQSRCKSLEPPEQMHKKLV